MLMPLLIFISLFILLGVGMLLLSVLKNAGEMMSERIRSNTRFNGKQAYRKEYARSSNDSKKIFAPDEGEYVKYEEIKD